VAVLSDAISAATDLHAADATAPLTAQRTVDLTKDNIHAQFSAGSAISATSGFTQVPGGTASRLPQVTVGASHAETTYTLTGTDIYTGAALTEELTVAAGAGTTKFTKPFGTVTAFSSDGNPGDTVDLEWGDTWVHPPARACHVGTSGNVACRLQDDSTDVTVPDVPTGEWPRRVRIIRITDTTASGLVLGW
jgi:hypothetical protein